MGAMAVLKSRHSIAKQLLLKRAEVSMWFEIHDIRRLSLIYNLSRDSLYMRKIQAN